MKIFPNFKTTSMIYYILKTKYQASLLSMNNFPGNLSVTIITDNISRGNGGVN